MFELLASMIDSGSSLWWLISSLWICKQICGLVADRNVLNLYSVVGVLDNISDQSHDGGRSRHRPRSIGPLRGPPHNRSTPPSCLATTPLSPSNMDNYVMSTSVRQIEWLHDQLLRCRLPCYIVTLTEAWYMSRFTWLTLPFPFPVSFSSTTPGSNERDLCAFSDNNK